MKKYVFVVIGLVAFIATIGLVTAGNGAGTKTCEQQSFVDEDGDGICDNWVDLNGDGINDNRLMDGSGNQYRYGQKQGREAGMQSAKGYGLGSRACQDL